MESVNGRKTRHSADLPRYVFDDVEVDAANRTCTRAGQAVTLTGRVFDLLLVFVQEPGRLIEKDELLERVWKSEFVEEGNLARNVSTLRKALGDVGREHRYISTVQGRGYRFLADVRVAGRSDVSAPAEPPPVGEVNFTGSVPNFLRRRVILAAATTVIIVVTIGFSLSKFSSSARTVEFPPKTVLQRITTSGNVSKVALSPDGNMIAFVTNAKGGESLRLRQVGVSNEVELVRSQPEHISNIRFSPDGKLVYYIIFSGDAPDGELYSLPVLGGPTQKIPDVHTLAISLAPDGMRFASVGSDAASGETSLVIRELGGASARHLAVRRTPDNISGSSQSVSWSADGNTIAMVENVRDGDRQFARLVGVDPATGTERTLADKRWNYIESVEWLRDGKGLLATGSDSGETPGQLWFISALTGEARRVTNDLSEYGEIAATGVDRPVVAIQQTQTSSITTGHIASRSSDIREIDTGVGPMGPVAVAPDGGIIFRNSAAGSSEIWLLAPNSKPAELTVGGHADSRGLAICGSGSMAVFASGRNGSTNLRVADINTGQMRDLTANDNAVFPTCTADGQSVIFQRGSGYGVRSTLWTVPLIGGEPTQLTDYFSMRPAVSPDGLHVAFFVMAEGKWRIAVAAASGGPIERSFDLPPGVPDRIARWSADSRSIYFAVNSADVGNIWQQELTGTAPKKITDFDKQNIDDFAISGDGSSFVAARSTTVSDVITIAGEPAM